MGQKWSLFNSFGCYLYHPLDPRLHAGRHVFVLGKYLALTLREDRYLVFDALAIFAHLWAGFCLSQDRLQPIVNGK